MNPPFRFRATLAGRRLVCRVIEHRDPTYFWYQEESGVPPRRQDWCAYCGLYADGAGEAIPADLWDYDRYPARRVKP